MPAKAILCLVCTFLTFHASTSVGQEGQQALQSSLERAYNQWRSAVIAGDAKGWAASISRYRQVVMRNLAVSQRKAFPESIFAVPGAPPPVAGLRLLEAQAVGPTAHLLYFGKIDMGGDPDTPNNIIMLKFFNENGAWKFDSTKLFNLAEQPDLRAQLQKGGAPSFLDYPEFTPPGQVPAVPPLCERPDHVTGCTLQSYGYQTKVTINGYDYPAMTDHAEKFLVTGGLKNGANLVTLTVKPTEVPSGEERLLQMDLFVASGKPGQPGTRVFHYESKDPKLGGSIKLPVIINEEVLSKGR